MELKYCYLWDLKHGLFSSNIQRFTDARDNETKDNSLEAR